MVVNESLVEALGQVSLGPVAEQILYLFGGLAGATLIFFIISTIINYKNLKLQRENWQLLRTLLEKKYRKK